MYKVLFNLLSKMPKIIRVNVLDKIARHFIKKYANLKVSGIENIPKAGSFVFISNHLSNADGLILHYTLKEVKEVYFLAGVKLQGELSTNLMLDLVPHIEIQPNKPDRKALRQSIDTLKGGKSILVFPEGTRSRTGKMLKGRSGVSLIAKQANSPIIPIGIWGTEKLLPINEEGNMSNEWFINATVNVNIGEPFYLEDLDINPDNKLIDEIMQKVANLVPVEYKGCYK
ncbi:1-acyl-sn-glycerol-3-phosphate acyltransferase [Desulfonispora thiosulfatigenes DSM 11270]|uniref:1-acyl-sn-glycerol-3-phosphate acyltransferase n=1 Tax=Desulfonispora thiosulfatigenes DSM 11270 TaxID=656914 RepID=A0A1W1VSK4_DESTI|nr:lysophospholipid acyltransferase family protein [Desulfonispora thiosulfatigenes]SMB96210.1 1-acyl-sn-glycerol-3-phosphate acyltransferase [Desulfonispora thiosulfatigenes DSM 11270]